VVQEPSIIDHSKSLDDHLLSKLGANQVFSADLVISKVKTQVSNLHILRNQIENIIKQKASNSGLIKPFLIDTKFKHSILHIKIECSFGNFEV